MHLVTVSKGKHYRSFTFKAVVIMEVNVVTQDVSTFLIRNASITVLSGFEVDTVDVNSKKTSNDFMNRTKSGPTIFARLKLELLRVIDHTPN